MSSSWNPGFDIPYPNPAESVDGGGTTTDFTAIESDVLPDGDGTRDLGAADKRWREIWGGAVVGVGHSSYGGVGTEQVLISNPDHDAGIFGSLNASVETATATLEAGIVGGNGPTGVANFVQGYACAQAAGAEATIRARTVGTFASGYAWAHGADGEALIESSGAPRRRAEAYCDSGCSGH